ncbi:PepSY domain-containing protein [Sphingomonas gilva]|uniref:PepSY domain-containing protein n=1 Tax=Sphingomonas gilva TaxID=2305907 RepID=A0A396RRZ0_9SPHN|nr:PepSY-associated TM helix domain-containing protein [Sphingomonas gilva]RHW17083.1 PepSY domain-containing protein [Sphingomonas gilva]
MTRRSIKAWYLVHKWTSLICTVFLLLLCITGLPLIFWEEIDHATSYMAEPAAVAPGTPPANLDTLMTAALKEHPGDVPLFLGWDDHAPIVYVNTGPRPDAAVAEMSYTLLDAHTGAVLGKAGLDEGVMMFIFRLHTDLFMGLAGMLFLGAMGLLFAAAIVSGIVVYGPFMRKLDFGTVRKTGSRRLKWLDLHNLIGAITLAWALVVGLTGAINTLALPLQQQWQASAIAEFSAQYQGKPRPERFASIDAAVRAARAAAPGMTPAFVSYPGTGYSGEHHYGVFLHGDTPITERLVKPVLVDVETGEVTAQPAVPWYITTLLLSQPLHFGDYGGLPLKIIWALLDLATIVVLVSGLYLWLRRAGGPADRRVSEILEAGKLARGGA